MFMKPIGSASSCLLGLALGAAGLLLAACDATPGPAALDLQQPVVSTLALTPDTVRATDLSDDQAANGQALVDFTIEVTARDADGTVDRVLVVFDPAYGTSTPGVGQLLRIEGDRYGGIQRYPLATDQSDRITVRAFAVDDDSLTSNQVVAQIHYLVDLSNAVRP
jgi:hypothetical protein